jgi:hypothetical protein
MIEITLNPDILPTKEKWILVCKMIKKQRELTDEEIIKVWDEYYEDIDIITFARAILKKASE